MQKFKANHLIHAIDLYQELLIADQPDSVSIDSITRYLSSEGYNINDRLARKLYNSSLTFSRRAALSAIKEVPLKCSLTGASNKRMEERR